jgi:hypothetical protein
MKLSVAALIALLAVNARADPTRERRESAVLVELFTSEGCSSCPPAERVLSRLLAHPPDGVRIIALEEHVDYWDELGWKDRFASPALTHRQEAYVRRLGLTGPYTPQLVVGGRSQVVGGDEVAAREAISGAASTRAARADIAVKGDEPASLVIDVRAEWAGGPADVILATVQDHARSIITSGENAGRVLDHVSAVRSLAVIGRGDGRFHGTVRVPRAGTGGADRIVLLVQAPDAGPVWAVAAKGLE